MAQSLQSKDAGAQLRQIRDRYFAVLESEVIKPARRDLTELRGQLQKELRGVRGDDRDAQITQRGLNRDLQKIGRALEGLEGGFRRAKTLRLNDLPKFRG